MAVHDPVRLPREGVADGAASAMAGGHEIIDIACIYRRFRHGYCHFSQSINVVKIMIEGPNNYSVDTPKISEQIMDAATLKSIWRVVSNDGNPTPYDFPISGKARKDAATIDVRLSRLFEDYDDRAAGRAEMNKRLREMCVPIFRDGNVEQRTKLSCWIVRDWGGIRAIDIERDMRYVREWGDLLGDFDPDQVRTFVASRNNHRISSWSKILAFRDPDNHAIYDARTSVALNVALFEAGQLEYFHMPESRNKKVKFARDRLKYKFRESELKPTLGYGNYLKLLHQFVAMRVGASILDAEMIIFANAPCVCAKFAPAHVPPVKLPSGLPAAP
jgi:hypothetical protein